jgi:hypothetical protein
MIGSSTAKRDIVIEFASSNYLEMTSKSFPFESDTFMPKRDLCLGYHATAFAINDSLWNKVSKVFLRLEN